MLDEIKAIFITQDWYVVPIFFVIILLVGIIYLWIDKVRLKLIWRHLFPIESFCKCCGRRVHDFIAPDYAWNRIEHLIKRGSVVCYDCFCDLCKKVGLPTVWYLQRREMRK